MILSNIYIKQNMISFILKKSNIKKLYKKAFFMKKRID